MLKAAKALVDAGAEGRALVRVHSMDTLDGAKDEEGSGGDGEDCVRTTKQFPCSGAGAGGGAATAAAYVRWLDTPDAESEGWWLLLALLPVSDNSALLLPLLELPLSPLVLLSLVLLSLVLLPLLLLLSPLLLLLLPLLLLPLLLLLADPDDLQAALALTVQLLRKLLLLVASDDVISPAPGAGETARW